MTEHWNDEQVEQLMRRGLAERADRMPEPTEEPQRAPQRRWAPIAAAAAAVVAVGVMVPFAVSSLRGGEPAPGDKTVGASPSTATPTGDGAAIPADWRVESWRDVSVRVPPDWGWGGGPISGEWTEGDLIDCGSGPFTRPGAQAYESLPRTTPYVGRPMMMTDACMGTVGQLPRGVTGDFVLLGSPYKHGVHDLGSGFTIETVEAEALNVSVVTRDPELRARILSTVAVSAVDPHGCDMRGPGNAQAPAGMEIASVEKLAVCVYDLENGGLVWSDVRDKPEARAYVEAYLASGRVHARCTTKSNVLLRLSGRDEAGAPVVWRQVVNTPCGTVDSGKGHVRLTKGAAAHWTSGATAAYVLAPEGSWDWMGMFRGMLG